MAQLPYAKPGERLTSQAPGIATHTKAGHGGNGPGGTALRRQARQSRRHWGAPPDLLAPAGPFVGALPGHCSMSREVPTRASKLSGRALAGHVGPPEGRLRRRIGSILAGL